MGFIDYLKYGKTQKPPQPAETPASDASPANAPAEASSSAPQARAMDTESYLASDEKAWLSYLSQPIRTHRKPGVTLKEEFERWRTARAQSRAATAAAEARAARVNAAKATTAKAS